MNNRVLHRMLVPMQFSASDSVSLKYAASMCDFDTSIVLLHVASAECSSGARMIMAQFARRAMQGMAELYLEDRHFEIVVAEGDPSVEIVKQAQAYEAELIVMTPERCKGLLALFRRNTAHRVARASSCPVILLSMYGPGVRRADREISRTATRARVFC